MIFGLDPSYTSWGPFIDHDTYQIQPVHRSDLVTAAIAFTVCVAFAVSAAYVGYKQTRRSQQPWKSAYIWMVWLEWSTSVVMAIECILFLLRIIRPSFYFFMSILVLWTVQTQCLLQIIINRIRIISHDRNTGKWLMIGAFVYMALINISVFCLWIPARLQISKQYIHVNEIWDRIEKVLYLAIDAYLNFYFITTVKANLVSNGLQKYNKLVRFNQCMIVISLSMDIVILGTMSLPNGLVYAMFHPLAYLVKLNIEMSMARLIKKIALGSNNPHNAAGFRSFSSSNDNKSSPSNGSFKTWAARQGSTFKSIMGGDKHATALDGGIQKTEEFTVRSAPISSDMEMEMLPHNFPQDKEVVCTVTSIKCDIRDVKGNRVNHFGGDEETLIKGQPTLVPHRRSEDSSITPSTVSDIR